MVDKIESLLDDGVPISPVCGLCARLQDMVDKTCDAFPNGIPKEIWDGSNLHKKSVNGDNGLLFELNI